MHDRFVRLIEAQGTAYTLITGPWEGRVEQATCAIDALLARCKAEPQTAP